MVFNLSLESYWQLPNLKGPTFIHPAIKQQSVCFIKQKSGIQGVGVGSGVGCGEPSGGFGSSETSGGGGSGGSVGCGGGGNPTGMAKTTGFI